MKSAAFYLGLACLFTHEMDAVPNHEWRALPYFGMLPDPTAMMIFVLAHVPLFAVLAALVASPSPRTRALSRLVIAVFLVIHGLLHMLSMGKPVYEFGSVLSNLLIFGGSTFGALYLILDARERRAEGP
jgi:hypothetical protein